MILDTSFLIDVLRGEPAVEDWERELATGSVPVVTAISVMELWAGVQRIDATEDERERVETLLSELTHVDFDRESAMLSGELSAALSDAGEPMEVEDIMIAAIAVTRDDTVLTRNPDHFERIEALTVETY